MSELVREQLFEHLDQELPYGTTVTIDQMKEEDGRTNIAATIHVEKEGHKQMVIGRMGCMIKDIGTKARLEMKNLIDGRIHLDLFVRVTEGWTRDPRKIAELRPR